MTTATTGVTARSILARADKRWADKRCDDPAQADYIDHLAQAVQAHLDDQTPAALTAADSGELQRLQALIDDLQTRLDDDARTITRQQGEISALKMERDQLAAAPAIDAAEVRRQVEHAVAAGKAEADQLRAQADELRIDLAAAKKALAAAQTAATTVVEQAHPEHTHAYPIDGTTGEIGPCSCSLIYPRYTLAAHQAAAEDQPAEDEPISVLLERVRLELDKANWGKP